MDEPLAQRILDIIFQDPQVRRLHKESLADWILDTQPRTAPLDAAALLQYLAAHQPDLLNRLKINMRLKEDLARALVAVQHDFRKLKMLEDGKFAGRPDQVVAELHKSPLVP